MPRYVKPRLASIAAEKTTVQTIVNTTAEISGLTLNFNTRVPNEVVLIHAVVSEYHTTQAGTPKLYYHLDDGAAVFLMLGTNIRYGGAGDTAWVAFDPIEPITVASPGPHHIDFDANIDGGGTIAIAFGSVEVNAARTAVTQLPSVLRDRKFGRRLQLIVATSTSTVDQTISGGVQTELTGLPTTFTTTRSNEVVLLTTRACFYRPQAGGLPNLSYRVDDGTRVLLLGTKGRDGASWVQMAASRTLVIATAGSHHVDLDGFIDGGGNQMRRQDGFSCSCSVVRFG